MKNFVIVVGLFAAGMLSSCSNQENKTEVAPVEQLVASFNGGDVILKKGILHFTSLDVREQYDKKLETDQAFYLNVSKKFGGDLLISQTRRLDDPTLRYVIDNVSANNLLTLNREGAYVIGDKYVRFGKDGSYWVDYAKSADINWANESALDLSIVKRAKYGRSSVPVEQKAGNARLQVDLFTESAPGGGDQYQWQRSSPAGYMKYVTELYTAYEEVYDQYSNLTQTWRLNIRAKLEWKIKANEGWNSWATEYRTITPKFSCSVEIGTTGSLFAAGGASFGPPYTQADWYQNDDWRRQLGSYVKRGTPLPANYKWYITGSGTLKQKVCCVTPNPEHTTVLSW